MHSVYWTPQALDDLTVLWTRADSTERAAITQATDAIDRSLAHVPGRVGESRGPFERIAFESPLGFMFEVDERRRIAFVVHVWEYRKRRAP